MNERASKQKGCPAHAANPPFKFCFCTTSCCGGGVGDGGGDEDDDGGGCCGSCGCGCCRLRSNGWSGRPVKSCTRQLGVMPEASPHAPPASPAPTAPPIADESVRSIVGELVKLMVGRLGASSSRRAGSGTGSYDAEANADAGGGANADVDAETNANADAEAGTDVGASADEDADSSMFVALEETASRDRSSRVVSRGA